MNDNEIKTLLEKTKDYSLVSKLSGLSLFALTTKNSRYWHIKITGWTNEKVVQLKQIFNNLSDEQVAEELKFPIKKIQSKARCLKLYKSKEYQQSVHERNSLNIKSGPNRHQFNKGSDSTIFYGTGKDHPNYVQDRSLVKGGRSRQDRFSITTMDTIRKQQQDCCNLCNKFLNNNGEFDHKIPLCIKGTADIKNCQLLCVRCHSNKTKSEQEISFNFKELEKLQEQYSFLARELI